MPHSFLFTQHFQWVNTPWKFSGLKPTGNTRIPVGKYPLEIQWVKPPWKHTNLKRSQLKISPFRRPDARNVVCIKTKDLLPPFPGYGFIPGLFFQISGISISRACLCTTLKTRGFRVFKYIL